MFIPSLAGLGGSPQKNIQNVGAQLQAALVSLTNGQPTDNVTTLSTASQLQSASLALKQLAGNVAQGLSLTQVADGGIDQIQDILGQLQSLAMQGSSQSITTDGRKQLNQQFQQLTQQIGQVVSDTTFNGQDLLDGSLSGDHALSLDNLFLSGDTGGDSVPVDDLSTPGLFNGQSPDILSSEGATQALAIINDASNKVSAARAGIKGFQKTLDYVAASIDSAVSNQEAASATLDNTDLANVPGQNWFSNLQQNSGIALATQATRLNPVLLELIN